MQLDLKLLQQTVLPLPRTARLSQDSQLLQQLTRRLLLRLKRQMLVRRRQ
jgi:hypothetical protein